MDWFVEHIEHWTWDTSCSESERLEHDIFAKDLKTLKAVLKETIAIEKVAFAFYKRAVNAEIDWDSGSYLKKLKRIQIRFVGDYLMNLDDNRNEAEDLEIYRVQFNEDWLVEFKDDENKEPEILPKETLLIKKDITAFIHNCVSTKSQPIRFHPLPADNNFMLDLLKQPTTVTFIPTLRQVPSAFPIPKESDDIYIDESLSQYTPLTDLVSNETINQIPESFSNIFRLDIIDIEEFSATTCHSRPFETFVVPFMDGDAKYFDSLNNYVLDESLEKGAIYKIHAPFMSNKPTFREPMDAMEFSMLKLFDVIRFEHLKELKVCDILKAVKEDDLVVDDIENENEESLNLVEQGHCLSKIREAEPYIICIDYANEISNSSSTKELQLPEIEPEPKQVTEELTEEPQLTENPIIQNSDIKVMEATTHTERNSITSEASINHSILDTVAATKMDTFVEATTATKRGSIDDELNDIMYKKRQRSSKVSGKILDSTLSNVLEGVDDREDATECSDNQVNLELEEEVVDPEILHCEHTIIMNSSRLSENCSLLKHFDTQYRLQIIEFDLEELDPDFVISSSCCALLINSIDISQVKDSGIFKYQEVILANLEKYDEFFIIIAINDSFSSFDQLLNFQLTLSLLKIQPIISRSSPHDICSQVANLALHYGQIVKEEDGETIGSLESSFLASCGINPFLSIMILQTMSLPQFISMSLEERCRLFPQLPPWICNHINELFSITWELD